MKVILFDIKARSSKKCINKDLAGGMGTGTWIGNSLRARIFERTKKQNVVLPVLTTAYLVSIFKQAGWEAEICAVGKDSDIPDKSADLALVPVSIVDCNHELEIVKKLKKKNFYTGVYGTFASSVPEFFFERRRFRDKGRTRSRRAQNNFQ